MTVTRDLGMGHFPGLAWRHLLRLLLVGTLAVAPAVLYAQGEKSAWSAQEKPLLDAMRTLRKLPEGERARTTKQLALQIRELPAALNKLRLADNLANLSTEGDLGHDTLQEVAATLADAVRETPVPAGKHGPAAPYVELAELARYEHVEVKLDDPQFTAALSKIAADNARREQADFTLRDLHDASWTLQDLRGSVVLVNFWATWCPPCRSEMPDLDALYKQFKGDGLLVLAISDEDASKVQPFIEQYQFSYPILLDPGRKVSEQFAIEGIPKSFVYGRDGKLVAQAIDMRTKRQFLAMLSDAGLK
ncbi:MAG: TlpA disulfide reductase family protein [Candidatus Acidiferrum sp.]|jgi:peroxiredoxin